nr:uncharacterized protein LOC109174213 [Ipomoea batatas]
MEDTLAWMVEEVTRRNHMEAQAITLRSGKALTKTRNVKDDPKKDEPAGNAATDPKASNGIASRDLAIKKQLWVLRDEDENVMPTMLDLVCTKNEHEIVCGLGNVNDCILDNVGACIDLKELFCHDNDLVDCVNTCEVNGVDLLADDVGLLGGVEEVEMVRMIVPKGVMFLQQGHALGITEATGHMTRCASSEGESANLGGVVYIMETPAPSKMGSSKQPMDDSSLLECDSHEYGTSCTYEDGGIEVLVRISRVKNLGWKGAEERGCTSKDEGVVSLAMVFGAAEANRAKPRLMDDMTAAATWDSLRAWKLDESRPIDATNNYTEENAVQAPRNPMCIPHRGKQAILALWKSTPTPSCLIAVGIISESGVS